MNDEPNIKAVAVLVLAALQTLGAIGAGRAVAQEVIARHCHTSTRIVQRATLLLNEQGHAVCTSCVAPMGMYVAETIGELDAYIAQLHSRLVGNANREKSLRKIRREWIAAQAVEPTGQRRLFA